KSCLCFERPRSHCPAPHLHQLILAPFSPALYARQTTLWDFIVLLRFNLSHCLQFEPVITVFGKPFFNKLKPLLVIRVPQITISCTFLSFNNHWTPSSEMFVCPQFKNSRFGNAVKKRNPPSLILVLDKSNILSFFNPFKYTNPASVTFVSAKYIISILSRFLTYPNPLSPISVWDRNKFLSFLRFATYLNPALLTSVRSKSSSSSLKNIFKSRSPRFVMNVPPKCSSLRPRIPCRYRRPLSEMRVWPNP